MTEIKDNEMETTVTSFPGFYESGIDGLIEQEIEQEIEQGVEEEGRQEKDFSYPAAKLAIAQGWLEYWVGETGINARFLEVDSPREYNFSTDLLVVAVNKDLLAFFLHQCRSEWAKEFRELLEEKCTSRPGFASFYSNDPADWNEPLDEWSSAQVAILMDAAVRALGVEIEDCPDTPCVYEAANAGWM